MKSDLLCAFLVTWQTLTECCLCSLYSACKFCSQPKKETDCSRTTQEIRPSWSERVTHTWLLLENHYNNGALRLEQNSWTVSCKESTKKKEYLLFLKIWFISSWDFVTKTSIVNSNGWHNIIIKLKGIVQPKNLNSVMIYFFLF